MLLLLLDNVWALPMLMLLFLSFQFCSHWLDLHCSHRAQASADLLRASSKSLFEFGRVCALRSFS